MRVDVGRNVLEGPDEVLQVDSSVEKKLAGVVFFFRVIIEHRQLDQARLQHLFDALFAENLGLDRVVSVPQALPKHPEGYTLLADFFDLEVGFLVVLVELLHSRLTLQQLEHALLAALGLVFVAHFFHSTDQRSFARFLFEVFDVKPEVFALRGSTSLERRDVFQKRFANFDEEPLHLNDVLVLHCPLFVVWQVTRTVRGLRPTLVEFVHRVDRVEEGADLLAQTSDVFEVHFRPVS